MQKRVVCKDDRRASAELLNPRPQRPAPGERSARGEIPKIRGGILANSQTLSRRVPIESVVACGVACRHCRQC